jgi:hypothetical protein
MKFLWLLTQITVASTHTLSNSRPTFVHRMNSNLCIAALGVSHAVSRSPAEPRPSRSSAGRRTAGSLGGGGGANPLIGKAAAADGSLIGDSSAPVGAAAGDNSLVYSAAVISLVGRQTDVLGAEAASTNRSLIIRYLFTICWKAG